VAGNVDDKGKGYYDDFMNLNFRRFQAGQAARFR
jgi:hypothetical protein